MDLEETAMGNSWEQLEPERIPEKDWFVDSSPTVFPMMALVGMILPADYLWTKPCIKKKIIVNKRSEQTKISENMEGQRAGCSGCVILFHVPSSLFIFFH